MARWSFRGVLSAIDLSTIARTEPTLVALHRRMVDQLGMTEAQAARVVENILGRALLRYGDHLVAGKGALVDRVITLRHALDDAYDTAFAFGAATGTGTTRAAADARLREIDRLLGELDDALEKLGRPMEEIDPPPGAGDALSPLHAEVSGTAATPERPGTVRRDIEEDRLKGRDSAGRRSRTPRIEGGRYRFTRNADGSYTKTFEDGASATFHIEHGRYRVEMFDAAGVKIGEAHEFELLPTAYGRRPRTTALMQANHGYQNSTMTALFGGYGYNGDAVPTIWMRDSRHGSPHGLVTAAQNSGKTLRNLSGVTLLDIRRWTIADLRLAGMPDAQIAAYLASIDRYFVRSVLPNIPVSERLALLGRDSWPPVGGGL